MRFSQIRSSLQPALDAKHKRLEALLEAVTEMLKASGVAMWGIFPEPKDAREIKSNPDRFHLFTISSWFEMANADEFYGYGRVELTKSNIGESTLLGKVVNGWNPESKSARKNVLTHALLNHPLFEKHGIQYMVAAPMTKNGKPWGVISVYREEGPDPDWFGATDDYLAVENEKDVMGDLAFMMPVMFEAIRNDYRLRLLDQVDEILRDAERIFEDSSVSESKVRRIFKDLSACIAKVFHCDEATIIMERLSTKIFGRSPKPFVRQETTYDGKSLIGPYEGKMAEGLTGWVLEKGECMWIPDLSRFEDDKEEHQKHFPGAIWKNSLDRHFEKKTGVPVSFMAAPVLMGNEVKGVIRCTSRRNEPCHYTKDDAEALQLVGSRIALAYHGWQLARRDKWRQERAEEESGKWAKFLAELGKLQEQALDEMRGKNPSRDRVCELLLSVLPKFVPTAGLCSIRLLEDNTLVPMYPPQIRQYGNERRPRFSLEGATKSLTVQVFRERHAAYFADVMHHEIYAAVIAPKDTRDLVLAPILVSPDEDPIGILAVRSLETLKNPEFCVRMADALGRQLALYFELLNTVTKLAAARSKAEHDSGVLQRIVRDIRHQIRGPLNTVPFHINLLLDGIRKLNLPDQTLERRFYILRGLCHKANSVAHNIRILADIEEGKQFKIKRTQFTRDKLEKLLRQVAEDHEHMSDPDHQVWFSVDTASLSGIPWSQYSADIELLEQMLFCLCDNAMKYSYAGKRVTISTRITGTSRLCVSIINRGPKVSLAESQSVIERGSRGEAAALFRGEGTGIGCFLTNQIMKAHEGEFQLKPTNEKGETIACLYFQRTDKISQTNRFL
ncbi:MAG: hypothetical protein B7Z37_18755 [Verrucomicrobia bacterium 12-59-8]|nr:MAG: hypothetical protein B7Z37_18755 [Verrucomicrobia bacterium 12-59-8]